MQMTKVRAISSSYDAVSVAETGMETFVGAFLSVYLLGHSIVQIHSGFDDGHSVVGNFELFFIALALLFFSSCLYCHIDLISLHIVLVQRLFSPST